VLEPLDFSRALLGRPLEHSYNALVQRGRTRLLDPVLRAFHWLIARRHRRLCGLLCDFLRRQRPAAVVSLMPNFNAALRDALRRAHPATPFLVVLTDFADYPPHFWIEPHIDRVVVGSQYAALQALALGIPKPNISRTSGMILHPRFHACRVDEARARTRRQLGIPNDAPVALLLFGGRGTPAMLPLSGALLREPDWHVVAICGHNRKLHENLSEAARESGGRLHPLPFTDRVADYMAASDVLLTKPGPGTLAEAMHVRLPVAVVADARTIPQERFNARFVEEQGLGVVVRDWRALPGAARLLLRNAECRERIQASLSALPANLAVYEVLQIIGKEIGFAIHSGVVPQTALEA
jgi:1,2-diacylglycerol 3-beta-galactosyltransferase